MANNIDRSVLVGTEAAMNQSRNMIYHLIRFMKHNDKINIKERLRRMGKNIAKTFANYWRPIDRVNLSNIKDVITTIYKKILNSSITIDIDEINKTIKIRDTKCSLCKYFYEDVGNFAGCEVLLGMVSEFISIINANSEETFKITLTPLEISESLSYGDKACIQIFKYEEVGI